MEGGGAFWAFWDAMFESVAHGPETEVGHGAPAPAQRAVSWSAGSKRRGGRTVTGAVRHPWGGKAHALYAEDVEPDCLDVDTLQRAAGGGDDRGGDAGDRLLDKRVDIGGLLRVVMKCRGGQPIPGPRGNYCENNTLEESLGIGPSPLKKPKIKY